MDSLQCAVAICEPRPHVRFSRRRRREKPHDISYTSFIAEIMFE